MRILAAQLNPTLGDIKGNTEKIVTTIHLARREQIEVVLFPEMMVCGYLPGDLLLHNAFIEAVEESLKTIIAASSGIAVIVGLVRRNTSSGEKFLFNSAAIIQNGGLLGFYDKCLLPTYDIFDERRYFEPGSTVRTWMINGKRVGVLICEDIWQHAGVLDMANYPYDPVRELATQQPDIVLNLSASPYQFHRIAERIKICQCAVKTLQSPLILCCQVGGNDQLVFDGYSLVVDGDGKLRQMGKGFDEDHIMLDLDKLPEPLAFHEDPLNDLYQTLVLGVRDYFHKLGFKRACLGLSGGIDSALVACIAVDALGKENVLTLNMPSRYSSSGSIADAQALASNLGIECLTIPIEAPFETFLHLLEPFFLNKKPDITEENIQARIRGMILMAFSNKHNYIVLSTGNKSEMAMGYCTLYGDMCGGLSVISDVTKERVYALANWLNKKQEIIPHSIIEKAPSAELRLNQKDSDSLPDYAVVDAVLHAYVEDGLAPEEIARLYTISLDTVTDLIRRIHLAEYKRRQAPPGIRVSKKAFDTGRSYPIVQRWI